MIRCVALSYCCLFVVLFGGCGRPQGVIPTAPAQLSGDDEVDAGSTLVKQRKFSEAIDHFERALTKPLKINTKSIVLTAIGNCYNELDQFEKSLEYHEKALAEDPKNFRAHVNKGIVYRLQGDYESAEKCYSKALELAPDYAELHASMGALYLFRDKFDKSIEHLERSIELNDTLAVAHSNLALAYASVGRFDDADAELKKAVVRGYHQPDVIRGRIEELRNLSSQTE